MNGGGKVENILKENMMLKEELARVLELVKENEAKQRGFRLIEDSFLMAGSLEEIDKKALRYIEEIFRIDKAALYINEDHLNLKDELNDFSSVFFIDDKTMKYAYIEKRPYYGTNLQELLSDFFILDNIGSYLIAPVIENGKIIASLNLYSHNPERISGDAQPDFIKDLLVRIGISLKKLHNTGYIIEQSKRDYLTGVYNKSMMIPLLKMAVKNYISENKPFSFVLLDMNNFKDLNNMHGYVEGDAALKEIARSIKLMLSEGEHAGRFGGDEFYALLNDMTPEDVENKFQNISYLIDEIASKYRMPGRLGISGGYVCIPAHMKPDMDNVEQIIKMADLGLYNCKITGKRICFPAVEAENPEN